MKLSNKLTLLVFSGFLIGIIISISFQIRSYTSTINELSNSALESNAAFYTNLLENEKQKLFVSLDILSENNEVLRFFEEKNKEALFAATLPIFDNLKKQYAINQVFFIEDAPGSTCILRMHRPEKFGDVVSRSTYLKSVTSNAPTSGLEPGTRRLSLRAVKPYYKNNVLIGFVEMSEEVNGFFAKLKEQTGDDYAITLDYNLLVKSGWEFDAKNASGSSKNQELIIQLTNGFNFSAILPDFIPTEKTIINKQFHIDGSYYVIGSMPIKDIENKTIGAVYFKTDITKYYTQARKTILLSSGLFVLAALIFGLLAIWSINKTFTQPIGQAIKAIKLLSEKHLYHRVPGKRSDEIGELNQAINEVSDNFLNVIETLQQAVAAIFSSSSQLTELSGKLAQGANDQASTTEEISSSMEEMLATINANAERAGFTGKVSSEAAQAMSESVSVFNQIIQSIQLIYTKIGIIQEIVQRTDMLAINASIEAAKAAEYGKGFNVISEEIRKLAEQSEQASAEIRKLAGEGNVVAGEANQIVEKIIPEIKQSALMVREIVTAVNEQQIGATQVNEAIIKLAEISIHHNQSSDSVSESANNLSEQARALKELISVFKLHN